MLGLVRHIHFVGIGGIGMSGLAEILLTQGFRISGSDLVESPMIQRLRQRGAQIFIGHHPDHVGNADVLVYSSAVDPATNPEVQAAKQRHIPVIRRAEMLAEISRLKYTIAVAGTHGKTTTTSMVGLVLLQAGIDPTIVVGGRVSNFGNTNARLGAGEWIVVEADEYDRSFLQLAPVVAVVTTVEEEHVDVYPTEQVLLQAFAEFANKVPFYGSVIACLDDPGVTRVLPMIQKRVRTYGTVRQSEVRAVAIQQQHFHTRFEVWCGEELLGRISLRVPGLHNVRNALAAVTVGLELQIPFETIQQALQSYTGVARRLERKGTFAGVPVFDDYAHHPTEVRVTLETLRQLFPAHRIVCIFQPHTYSRTQRFYTAFAQALLDADVVLLMEVYPAREAPMQGVSSRLIGEAAQKLGHQAIQYVEDPEQIPELLKRLLLPQDVIVTIGAGSVWKVAERLVQQSSAEVQQGSAVGALAQVQSSGQS